MDEANANEAIWTEAVIEQNRRWMLAYLFAATGDAALAEDLVQETFAVAYQKRLSYEAGRPFGAWLRGIARNLLQREHERRERAPLTLSPDAWKRFDRAAESLEDQHLAPGYEDARLSALRGCIEKLERRARELIDGRYAKKLSVDELAERCGLAPHSVPVLLHRARAALSGCVEKNLRLNAEVL